MAEEAARSGEHRPRLGRGLAALLGSAAEEPSPEPSRARRKTAIEFLRPNPRNPRKNFSEAEIEELAASIRERGVIQPILARSVVNVPDAYEIVAGERRWRAAQRAGLHEVPIIVIEASDKDALAIAIIENVQRADLNPLEEANGYAQLMDDHGYSQAEVSHILGKSRSHVANTLRLRNLPHQTRALLASGEISAGHGRALLALPDPDAVAKRIVAEGLTVRAVERLAQAAASPGRGASASGAKAQSVDADTRALQNRLAEALGVKVVVRHDGVRGEIRLGFENFEQLEDICQRLMQPAR
ncbi:MAG TPA: ParB/RepB/Spo0J family partition protein [Roseiarcus sp.]|nr:ParB/RepB/Spo0J family partition protein [Roseiarcus sp.]